jgi:hypothetical protein
MFKMSTSIAALFVAGLVGLACGSSDTIRLSEDSGSDLLAGGLGTPCDDLAPNAGPSQGIVNASALQCRSELCVKPPVQPCPSGARA